MARQSVSLIFSLCISTLVYTLLPVAPDIQLGLGLLCLIGLLWMTETFHISVTALLVPLLAVVSGIFTVQQAFSQFANPVIFLFLGGFALAAAMREQQLDLMIANKVLGLAGGRLDRAVLLLFATTAFLSMWISNTATTAMMLPLALGMLSHIRYQEQPRTYWFVLIGIAYSANIGGIGTLVGSPPNVIAAAAAGFSFADWASFGIPLVFLMLPLALLVLKYIFRPDLTTTLTQQPQGQSTASMTHQQWLTLGVFILTVALWLFSNPLATAMGIDKGFDSLVALNAVLMLCILRLTSWNAIQGTTDWGVLMLFGGGLTLSAMLKATGTSVFLAQTITEVLTGAPLLLFTLAVTLFVVMLTEVTSNTASSALLVPVFVSIAQAMQLPATILAALIAIAASCAFMLPVATPPNAIVFGSGYLQQKQMMRAGAATHLCIVTLLGTGTWLLLQNSTSIQP
ncbi:MAG: DASS family sodium-coupled anion symporter [Marinobacterium sp.]|nr:DASS family sodium-coupled anion symporter [Marinobacterium sp.]